MRRRAVARRYLVPAGRRRHAGCSPRRRFVAPVGYACSPLSYRQDIFASEDKIFSYR